MDYLQEIEQIINNTNLNKDSKTILSNKIVDADNQAHKDNRMGLPNTYEIKNEHRIGKRIINYVNLTKVSKRMDNITYTITKQILSHVQSLNCTDIYLANNFNTGKDNIFFDVFDDYVSTMISIISDCKDKDINSEPKIYSLMVIPYMFIKSINNPKFFIKNHYSNHMGDYYSHVRYLLKRVNNIFVTYLYDLHLINKKGKFSSKKINILSNPTLINNYCRTHCTSIISSDKFSAVLQIMFKAFKLYENNDESSTFHKIIGIPFAYYFSVQKTYEILGYFDEKGKTYSDELNIMTYSIITLNLFADYVTRSAFTPNKVAGQAINKITCSINLSNKVDKVANKLNKEIDKEHKKEDNKN